MKRILFVLPRLTSGGAERQAVTLAVSLKDKGYDVSVLCYSEGAFFEKALKDAGIPVFWKVCNYYKRVLFVTRFIRKQKFDAVISFLPTPNFLNCLAAIYHKKWKVITSERSSVEKSLTSKRGRVFCFFQRFSDAIVCNSENARQMWLRHYPQYKEKLKTIYNAVVLPTITGYYKPRNLNKTNIVVAATVYKIKNPMGLIDALCLMTEKELADFHIDWYGGSEAEIGNHEEYDKVVKAIQTNNLKDVITLHKPTSAIAQKMFESDYVALFSQLEGLPNAICEGMMIGKPIIMSRCSDYNVLVNDGVNGFLCDWDNPNSIKDALIAAATIPDKLLEEMGKASKDMANVLFSPDAVVKQWVNLIS